MQRGRRHWELRVCLLTLTASTASQLPAPQDVSAQRSALSVLQLRPSICDAAPSAATRGAAKSGGMRASETCCSCAQCCCNDIPGALPRRGQMHPLRGGGDGFGFLDRIIAAFLACVLRGEDDGACEARVGDGDPDIMWTEEDDPGELDQLGASLQARMVSMPQPSIEHDAIRKRRQLGAGGFAVVFEADAPRPGKKGGGNVVCACKVFSFIAGMGERQTNFFKNWLHELKVLEYLSTRPECLVVGFYGYSLKHESSDGKIIVQICMELMRGGSLRDNLLVLKRKGQLLSLKGAFNIMRQVALALQGLHAPTHDVYATRKKVSIVHRDMKPENILLSDKLTSKDAESVICKLGDVGLASLRTDPSLATRVHATTKVGKAGTYPYIAPETLLQGKCTPASDVFSLGLLMWELIEGETPFHDVANLDGMLPLFWQDGKRPPMDSAAFLRAPRALKVLIEKCWQTEKHRRPTADQIVQAIDEMALKLGITLDKCGEPPSFESGQGAAATTVGNTGFLRRLFGY